MRGLIVTGGNIDDRFACDEIKNGGYDLIIAADSGMDFLYRHHITPDIIVGDFDSADHEVLAFFEDETEAEIIRLNPIKDDTDTEFAVRDAISRGVHTITILGATGSRVDHMLANIVLLGIGLEKNVDITLLDAKNRICMKNASFALEKSRQFGQFVSLIPFSGDVKHLTLSGFKYNLSDYTLTGFNSLGVSNEIVDPVARVEFSEGILVVIEARD